MKALFFIAALLPAFASGAVYKCVNANGSINFSDQPCSGASQGGEIEVRPANSGGRLGLPEDFKQADAKQNPTKQSNVLQDFDKLTRDLDDIKKAAAERKVLLDTY